MIARWIRDALLCVALSACSTPARPLSTLPPAQRPRHCVEAVLRSSDLVMFCGPDWRTCMWVRGVAIDNGRRVGIVGVGRCVEMEQ